MTIAMDKEVVRETFRLGILAALDMLAKEVFQGAGPLAVLKENYSNGLGAADEDLPALFKTIDAHVDRLCQRYDVVLVEDLSPPLK